MSGNQNGVLILKATASSMKAAEIFLKNREWRYASTHNLKEAINFIIKYQPKYIFIAADHPNKKVRSMPKLLAQAFPVTVIAYTESTSNQSIACIQNMGLEYNLYPPVSGPAIVRLVAKIEKDIDRREKEEKLRLDQLHPEQPGKKEPDSFSSSKNSLSQAKAALQQMLQAESEEAANSAQVPSSDKKAGMLNAKNSGLKYSGGIQYNPPHPAADSRESKFDPFVSDWETEKPKVEDSNKHVDVLNSTNDTIIFKGAVESLDGALNHKVTGGAVEKIGELNQIVCLIVDSARFSGYLIAAMGKKRLIDEDLMKNIRAHLYEYLKKNGEIISEKELDSMELKIQQVGFQGWASDQADFLIRSIHDDNEVALAFFPTKDVNVNLEESFAEHMMKMKIDDISANMELAFDVFIYLPENQKYVRYNKEGQKMFGEQVTRLKDKGVTHLHMNKDSRDQVRKYRAQNYLNEMILAYKKKKSA